MPLISEKGDAYFLAFLGEAFFADCEADDNPRVSKRREAGEGL